MIDSKPDCGGTEVSGGNSRWIQRGVLGAVCVVVVGVYAYTAHSGFLESLSLNPVDTYYNLLVRGFRVGQLSLKRDVPPGLAQLADPYDPTANFIYRSELRGMHDLSYYKGKLYLYFGVTPSLILFWPFAALTGHYLFHKQAVTIFCAIGFLASVGLLRALWQRYFAGVSIGVVAACALALGLATGVPVLLARSDVYEVPISCGYMLTMLALGAIWCALHEPERRNRWLAVASLAYGLAVGARPSLLLGAIILLVPVIRAWRERWPRKLAGLMAATGPIVLIGLGLMLYNALRFDSPFEFGQRYQLAVDRQDTIQHFSLRYFWFNFRVYFLKSVGWSCQFPFVQHMVASAPPPGHGGVEKPFGILTNIPLVWVTLAVPLVWRRRPAEAGGILRWFIMAVGLLFGVGALTLGFYYCICSRFEVDFLPALVLLAVVGILELERALADHLPWRHAARWGWGLLLGFSVAFNLLASVERYAEADNNLGVALEKAGRVPEAIVQYEQALRLTPGYPEAHYNLGNALLNMGRLEDAIGHWDQASRLKPDFAEAHYNLGVALTRLGRLPEAVEHLEQALRIEPKYAETHNSLGAALMKLGRLPEAVEHWEQALRLKPNSAEFHNNLGIALFRMGRLPESLGQYEQAVRLKPDYFEAHFNMAVALEQAGRIQEAIGHYEQVLRLKPDLAEVQNRLARLRAAQGLAKEGGH